MGRPNLITTRNAKIGNASVRVPFDTFFLVNLPHTIG